MDTNLSFTQSLEVELVTNNGTVQWLPNPNNSPLVARVLGAVPLGGTFATLGPQVVTMVLRDPPGSESFATWEQGVSQTNSVSFNVDKNDSDNFSTACLKTSLPLIIICPEV